MPNPIITPANAALLAVAFFGGCSNRGESSREPNLQPLERLEIDRDAILDHLQRHPAYQSLEVGSAALVLNVVGALSESVDLTMRGFESMDPNREFGGTANRLEQLAAVLAVYRERYEHFRRAPSEPVPDLPAPPLIASRVGPIELRINVVRRVVDPHYAETNNAQMGLAEGLLLLPVDQRTPALAATMHGTGAVAAQIQDYEALVEQHHRRAIAWED